MNVFARLKPGVSLAQASAAMSVIAQGLNKTIPTSEPALQGNCEDRTGRRWVMLRLVMKSAGASHGIVGLICIACANVANLLLARRLRDAKKLACAWRWRERARLIFASVS